MSEHTDIAVFCLCAAWCRTCDAYAGVFEALSQSSNDQVRWHWVDIEDQAEAIGDVDVENFPTLLIADAHHAYFWGPVLPHASVAARLLERVRDGQARPLQTIGVEALRQRLFELLA